MGAELQIIQFTRAGLRQHSQLHLASTSVAY